MAPSPAPRPTRSPTRSPWIGLLMLVGCLSATGCTDTVEPTVTWASRSTPEGFELSRNGGQWQRFWPIGVNFGTAVPGTSPGEFTATAAQIRRWLDVAAQAGATTIRTYTVQSPEFYKELRAYNMAHEDKPLFLLQGAWIKEPEGYSPDYLSEELDAWVRDEITKVVRAVHGDIEIPPGSPKIPQNWGRANGVFEADVSPWLLGWLFGREMEPYTIESTLAIHNKAGTSFAGRFFSITGSNPIEPWVVGHMDRLVALEHDRYKVQHPIGFSNWPTLDPLDHWTEPKIPVSAEDTYKIDLENMGEYAAWKAGVFMSYHAYPYYPDFILYQPEYQGTSDAKGKFSYIGYLEALRKYHAKHALIVAEIGHPSSVGNGHQSPSGQDHGGFSEQEQGPAILRSLGGVVQAGLDGAIVFSIIDEWFKRAWVVERVEKPVDRRRLWHNVMNPEQNFGLIAMHAGDAKSRVVVDGKDSEWGAPDAKAAAQPSGALGDGLDDQRRLRDLTVTHDAAYLHVRVRMAALSKAGAPTPWDKIDLVVAFDTIDPNRGDSRLDPAGKVEFGRRVEHLVRIHSATDAQLMVDKPFDLFGLWHRIREPWQKYRTTANDAGEFNLVRTMTNENYEVKDPVTGELKNLGVRMSQETGRFVVGSQTTNSLTSVAINAPEGIVEIRVPWNLLHFTDPSSLQIVDDNGVGGGKSVSTSTTTGVAVAVAVLGGSNEDETTLVDSIPAATKTALGHKIEASGWVVHTWKAWDDQPAYHERNKPAVAALGEGLAAILPLTAAIPGAEPAASGGTP